MRRVLLGVLTISLVVGLTGVATAVPPGEPFKGTWEAVDIDGSNLDMVISPALKVSIKDDGTTVCGLVGGVPFYRSVAKGTATQLSATEIEVTLTLRCLGGGALPGGGTTGEFGPFVFTHDGGTDTLSGFNSTFSRR